MPSSQQYRFNPRDEYQWLLILSSCRSCTTKSPSTPSPPHPLSATLLIPSLPMAVTPLGATPRAHSFPSPASKHFHPLHPSHISLFPSYSQKLHFMCSPKATHELLVCLFNSFPGMEYCDLKTEPETDLSKGHGYVSFSNPFSTFQVR